MEMDSETGGRPLSRLYGEPFGGVWTWLTHYRSFDEGVAQFRSCATLADCTLPSPLTVHRTGWVQYAAPIGWHLHGALGLREYAAWRLRPHPAVAMLVLDSRAAVAAALTAAAYHAPPFTDPGAPLIHGAGMTAAEIDHARLAEAGIGAMVLPAEADSVWRLQVPGAYSGSVLWLRWVFEPPQYCGGLVLAPEQYAEVLPDDFRSRVAAAAAAGG
jgi:hypothetical protein